MKFGGTVSIGVKAPIIRQGDNLIEIVCNSLLNLVKHDNVTIQDGDIVCITESVVAIAQGNFATTTQIAEAVKGIFSSGPVGLVFPIFSRNRFSMLLKGIRQGVKKIIVQLSYPADEVGNKLVSEDEIIKANINPYLDTLTKKEFREIFKNTTHEYTKIDYIDLYQDIIGEDCEIIFSNNPQTILNYTKQIIVANVHNRERIKADLMQNGGEKIIGLDDILTESVFGSGYNSEFGLLGSNLSGEDSVKLFPRDAKVLVYEIQKRLKEIFGKHLEVMVYGDGAFKDPRGGIWEFADPVVSPGFTNGLLGTPNEIKLKFLANSVKNEEDMKKMIKEKADNLSGSLASQGTTPRQIVDLLGSLADLTSGSGDKGTPFVLIQNYFDNFASK